jgi:hypothetical protein
MNVTRTKDQTVSNIPDPKTVVEALRDTGYELNTAVCDIIDNSIAWGGKIIEVRMEMDLEGNVSIFFADNGMGMDNDEIIMAMKYGSTLGKERREKGITPIDDSPVSLSKFGIGLKTASTAMCRKVSLVSRNNDCNAIRVTLDLDHIAKTNNWDMLKGLPSNDQLELLEDVSKGKSGTVVCWENIDRLGLKKYDDPTGSYAKAALKKKGDSVKENLSKVYQRYIGSKNKYTKTRVKIMFDGETIGPWDPFVESESDEILSDKFAVQDTYGEDLGIVTLSAWILPRKEDFSSPEIWNDAYGGNSKATDKQGIYVYRENRLIHDGDWLKLYSKEPHYNLLRVNFSFEEKLDRAFNIDIKKSTISIDETVSDRLKEFLVPARREAQNRNRGRNNRSKAKKSEGAHGSSNRNISEKEKGIVKSTIEIIDEAIGKIKVTNQEGTHIRNLIISNTKEDDKLFVNPVANIDNGLLWEPALVNKKQAVNLNTSHDYYGKVYIPNHSESVNMQGLDSLFWALSTAELNCTNDQSKDNFEEMRYEVSRALRKLVADLPEPDLED